jgi:hypothetical protein
VYSSQSGFGRLDDLPLSTAVQVSANFPGAFPVRIVRAPLRAFLGVTMLSDQLMFSDGGVFDNLADAWFVDRYDREQMQLDVQNLTQEIGQVYAAQAARLSEQYHRALNPIGPRQDDDLPKAADSLNERRLGDEQPPESLDEQQSGDVQRLRELHEKQLRQEEELKSCTEAMLLRAKHVQLIVVNASPRVFWKRLRRIRIPLLGEITGFTRITNVMYNNITGTRAEDLRARFEKDDPSGCVVNIDRSLPFWPEAKSWRRSIKENEEIEKRKLRIADYLGIESSNGSVAAQRLDEITHEVSAIPTTLKPLGINRTAKLLYHGYLQAMLSAHLFLDSPLLEPAPDFGRFIDIVSGHQKSAYRDRPARR